MKKAVIIFIFFITGLIVIGCGSTTEENKDQPKEVEEKTGEEVQTNKDILSEPENMLPEIESKKTKQFKSSELVNIDSNFNFQAGIPENWQVEYVAGSKAINFYDPNAQDETNLDKSQIFVKYFNASSFLTLSTVTIYSKEDLTINGYPAVHYDIEKKQGVADFPSQPKWRNERHLVTDIRSSDENPTTFYVLGRRPDLDEEIFDNFLQSISFN